MNDSTTEFMKGAILGYCQTHEPEEVASLFDDVFLILDIKKAANISNAIAGRFLGYLNQATVEYYKGEKL